MNIVINSIDFFSFDGSDLFYNYLVAIAIAKPADQFIFITPTTIDSRLADIKNVKPILSAPKGKSLFFISSGLIILCRPSPKSTKLSLLFIQAAIAR